MGVSVNGGTPTAGWFIMGESHLEMDDDWGYPCPRKPPQTIIEQTTYQNSFLQAVAEKLGKLLAEGKTTRRRNPQKAIVRKHDD